jgi:hypothetical protein
MAKERQSTHRLTQEARDEITRRVLAGEKAGPLAVEFEVSRAYVSLLKMTALHPERIKRKAEAQFSLKLTTRETEELKRRFETTTPEDNHLIPAVERWTLDHGFQLAIKLFGKKPSKRAVKDCMGELLIRRPDSGDPKPKPPKPITRKQIDPEFAKDRSFVAYVQSPVYQKIAQREYELALAEWERRNPGGEGGVAEKPAEEAEDDSNWQIPAMQHPSVPGAPGRRVGKHAKSKGSPFTPAKRRKKKPR